MGSSYMPVRPPEMQQPASEPMLLEKLGYSLVLFLIVAEFSRFLDLHLSGLHLPGIAQGLALAIGIVTGAFLRGSRSKIAVCMILLTVWMVACIPTAYWRGGSMAILTQTWMKVMMNFFFMTCLLVTIKQCRRALYAIGIGMGIGIVIVSANGYTIAGRLASEGGSYQNSNDLAMSLLMAMPCVGLMIFDRLAPKLIRIGAVGIFVLLLISLLKTGSREGLLALTIIGTSLFIRVPMKQKVLLAGAASMLCVVFLVLLPHELKVRYLTLFSTSGAAESSAEAGVSASAADSSLDRWNLLKSSIDITLHHPIFGVGPGNFAPYKVHMAEESGQHSNWNGTHNTYTQFFSEMGIPGGALFIAALVFGFKETNAVYQGARKLQSAEAGDLANIAFAWRCSLLAFAIVACFGHVGYQYTVATIMGISAALGAAGRTEIGRLRDSERVVVMEPLQGPRMAGRRLNSIAVR